MGQTNMTILIFLLLSFIFSITNASPFTDSFAISYIMNDVQEKVLYDKYLVKHNYYNFTRDTNLQIFPIDYNPQCIIGKHLFLIYLNTRR